MEPVRRVLSPPRRARPRTHGKGQAAERHKRQLVQGAGQEHQLDQWAQHGVEEGILQGQVRRHVAGQGGRLGRGLAGWLAGQAMLATAAGCSP